MNNQSDGNPDRTEQEQYTEKPSSTEKEGAAKLSRRKLLASLGITGAAVASGGLIHTLNGSASVLNSVYGNPDTVGADEVSYQYAANLTERTVGAKLRESMSVLDFGAAGDGIANDAPAIQSAIDHAAGNGGGVIFFPKGSYRLAVQVKLPSNITLQAEPGTVKIIMNGTTLKVPFITAVHCKTDHFLFATNIHLYGLDFINEANLVAGIHYVTYCAWYSINVRNVSMRRCTSHNMGLQYMTHAVRQWGTYNQALASNTDPNIDPAVSAGLSATGGDLNKDFLFADNRTYTQDGALVQMFRYEFCEKGLIHANDSVRGSISGWGGAAGKVEGGNLQHYRRCRHVNRTQNRLYEPNALYIINGYMCNDTGNYVERGIDLGIDYEGCFYCTAEHNTVKNSGNGSLAIFYASVGNKFIGNTCIEDGSAQNINDLFQLGTKWDPSSGNYLFVNKGSGFTNIAGTDECVFIGNEFIWLGETGAGIVDIGDFSHYALRDNKFTNVVIDMNFNNSGNSLLSHNEFHITRDVRKSIIDIGDLSGAVAQWTTIEYNDFYIKAQQSSGTSAINLFNDAGQPVKTYVIGNRIYDFNNYIESDISYEGASASAAGIHIFVIRDNLLKNVRHKSAKLARVLLQLSNNYTLQGKPFPAGDGAPVLTQLGDGVQIVAGTKFPYANLEGKTKEGLIAINDGFLLADVHGRQASASYQPGDVAWAAVGAIDKVYFCITGGTSSTGSFPGNEGNAIPDGSVVWRYLGRRQVLSEYGMIGNEQ
ncbi:hypothetical protein FE784_03175 [Paenibacillus hemerocallicola]|uniref:Rhamnogalacturonase A/B/Epimerase-like pectate lyase domain-containing protein n=1 Tax=Paenibacillus hemerocallicola TaxID=1172614 RepID=A0A5C4TGK0_9BACL|nr:glycosyl hydrolase family 28-related protein [Paenibacillus hemerocallicola]TNJ67766.1 hypothetical protein FE784_03175 [Paenibacillus hemerocallicola]